MLRRTIMYVTNIILLLYVNGILNISGARILAIFPTPSISHQVVFRPIVNELSKRGHEITVLTPDPVFQKTKNGTNITEIDVHDISYDDLKVWMEKQQIYKVDFITQIQLFFTWITNLFEKQIQVPNFKNILDKKFDLLLVEACVRPTLGLTHVFKAPVIQISSLGGAPSIYSAFGAPSHLTLHPSVLAQRLYNLTIIEKILQVFKINLVEYLISKTGDFDFQVMKRNFGDDVQTYDVLQNNVQMLFFNEHPIWIDNRPISPNIIYIGGVHEPHHNELPEDIKTFLDESKNGVIYISFGSNVKPSVLPKEKIGVIVKVLSQLPYDVLWKWDKDELPEKSNNIRIYKWFPQADLLKHQNIKLFITQGGLQSTDEAINAAVPLIGIPMHGDHWYNVEKYVHHRIGVQLDMSDLTKDSFKSAVETVIEDKSFKANILKLRSLMKDRLMEPKNLAVEWIEYILLHGGTHLKSAAMGLSFMEYYEVSLVLIMTAILITILIFSVISVTLILNILKKKFIIKR